MEKGQKLEVVNYALREARNTLRSARVGHLKMANDVAEMVQKMPEDVKLALYDNIAANMTPFGAVEAA